jgi:hypothetical protein
MKKISIIAMMTAVSLSAFAEEAKTQDVAPLTEESAVVAQAEDSGIKYLDEVSTTESEKTSNPKTKFPRGMQIGLGVSPTTGLNMFVGYNNKNFDSFWAKRFGIRFDFASTSPVKSMINRGVDNFMGDDGYELNDELSIIDGAIKAKHMGAMVDFYPFGNTWLFGGWRITGGYMFGQLNVDADLKGTVDGLPAGTIEFEFGGTKYRYLGNNVYGTASADWKFHGPYLGTGFDIGLFWGFKIYMDAGVVFTNKAAELDLKVDVNNLQYNDSGTWKNFTGDPSYTSLVNDFNNRKDAELQDAQDELDKYKFYPLIKLGFMYRF